MTTLNVNITMEQFMMLFQQFPKKEQQTIAKKITNLTLSEQKKSQNEILPEVKVESEINTLQSFLLTAPQMSDNQYDSFLENRKNWNRV